MATTLDKYTKLKKIVERTQRDADRASGALAGQMKILADEFGCDTIDDAETKLKALQTKATKAETAFAEALTDFEEEWGDTIEGTPATD